MRNFDIEKENYNIIYNIVKKGGYTLGNELETEIYLENNESAGLSSAYLPCIISIWMDENGNVLMMDGQGYEYDLDNLDGTELSCLAFDLETYYQN